MSSVRLVAAALGDLVFPDCCPGCGHRSLPPACPRCLSALAGTPRPRPPDPLPAGLPAPWAVTAYAGAARELIVAHKEHARLGLATPLGNALGRVVLAVAAPGGLVPPAIAVVPVPSSPAAVRRRGHDPMARIARRAVQWLRSQGVAAQVVVLLRHARSTEDQSGLSHARRAANLAGALTVRAVRPGVFRTLPLQTRLVVVDDVVTTGATLAEAVRALRSVGFPVTGVATVAATRRRVPLPTGWSSG